MNNAKGVTQFLLAYLILHVGCAAYMLDDAQSSLRSTFARGHFEETTALIEEFESNQVYKSKDEVLLNLEYGSAHHFAGNYYESNRHFERAELSIEELYTKSVSRALQSFVINDTQLAYDGEDYEDVYLNVFKALNYIHLGDLEGALVETRRVSYKLSKLNSKYTGLVEALSKADTTHIEPSKWKTGKTNFQNSAFAHYLSTILFSKTGKSDDARISYNNLIKAFSDQPHLYRGRIPTSNELSRLLRPNSYNVLVTAFSGRSPQKIQIDTRLYFGEIDTYLKFSLPQLRLYDSQVARISVSVDNETPITMYLLENMDLVAREVYKIKEPIIYARTLVRASLKALATNQSSKNVSKKNESLGEVLNFLGKVAQEVTEKADLRSWQTMPGKVHATVLKVPPGKHKIKVQYFSRSGTLLHSNTQVLHINENNNLDLVESIFWN